jgi:hypothetical protein
VDARPGTRVRARGLTWIVLEADRAGDRQRLMLRCAEGDMAGLEWELHVPPDHIDLIEAALDPRCPAPLSRWRLMHRAHALNELPAGASFVVHEPGRVRIEPYQLVPLMRALDMPRPRLLLADGVGLGKTIQAGLIAAELIARRRVHRILIVAPSGPLLSQWEQETRLRFGLKFSLVTNAAELWDIRRAHELGSNPFASVALCLTSLDFAKQDHVLEELERTAWDLVIIDEAHHCVGLGLPGAQENTDRRRLAEVLASRTDGLLLLTATPHDGHDAHFASLIALLDPSLVDGAGGLVGHSYRRHVIRRLKAHIRDPRTGAPLFRHRHVTSVKIDAGGPEHEAVRDFHRALYAFVVPRLRNRGNSDDALAFVSLLKRSVSTVSACLNTLRVVMQRIARRTGGEVETRAVRAERARALRAWRRRTARFGGLGFVDERGQEALEAESMAEALYGEPGSEPARLIQLGTAAEAHDPKLAALVLEVRLIRLAHSHASILIYTEYTDSQVAAAHVLRQAAGIGGEVLTIGGQDTDEIRATAAGRFAENDDLILISTDSLAEGLNLHRHCFHLIHLDLPYNPNRLEQRNGRIDRYGQQKEPEIRYLYLPGTFEERLLLHLIAKYEKARASLDVMPDTLGVTAGPEDYGEALTGGLSEVPDDLFKAETEANQTFDRTVEDSSPEAVAELMREIDRAFDSFDLMAVAHGWHGARGINAGMEQLPRIEEAARSVDLAGFVGAVIEAGDGKSAVAGDELRLPRDWVFGLDGQPGFDPAKDVLHFTRDIEVHNDPAGRPIGFLGRAHPLVLRAIRLGCQVAGEVAVSRGARLALLSTFEIQIPIENRVVFRRIVTVMTTPDRPPEEIRDWPTLCDPACAMENVWDRLFAFWAEPAWAETDAFVSAIADREHDAFVAGHLTSRREQAGRSRRWLRVRADLLCGPFVSPTGDLFGAPRPGPAWRTQEDPLSRLISLATDPETSVAKRREANDTLETRQAAENRNAAPGPVMHRPIGMLMLVPADAL